MQKNSRHFSGSLQPGDFVRVRDEREVLASLDGNAKLEGLPFSPEMHKYCRKVFRVLKRPENIMIEGVGIRHIKNAVILDGTVCDGESHEGCAKTCFLLWRLEWLEKIDSKTATIRSVSNQGKTDTQPAIYDKNLCQAASLIEATTKRSLPKRYLLSVVSGHSRPTDTARRILKYLNARIQRLFDVGHDRLEGNNTRTPTESIGLKAGDIVEIKKSDEIRGTLDRKGRNRGLHFTREMSKYCGKRYRVLKQVDKMIIEANGKMRPISNTVILEGVTCGGAYHEDCPRNCYCLWREIWLRKIVDSLQDRGL